MRLTLLLGRAAERIARGINGAADETLKTPQSAGGIARERAIYRFET